VDAMDTLLMNIESLERAAEFAVRCNDPQVWYKLGKAQLQNNQIPEAIDSYLKAEDPTDYMEVIQVAEREENCEELVRFLKMARTKVKDQHIDSELLYAFAKTDNLPEMEEFVSGTTTANTQAIGDRLFDEGSYKAAKILYQSIPNNGKMAACHVQLREYSQAVEAAKKANNPKTWKDVNLACVAAQEFRCAQIAGMHIIVHPDHLDELIMQYERYGYFEELIALIDSGLGNERAHVGMFTELGVLYAKYKPERLMDFIKMNISGGKLNIPKLLRSCERHYLWEQAVFLYIHYDEYDSAANTMMAHSPTAFAHDQFLMVMQKVSNMEIYYRAIDFYISEAPMQINSLLNAIAAKVDHGRVVQQVKKGKNLSLILPYLKQVQQHNIAAVNEAVNEVYLEGEQHEELRASIDDFDNFDQIAFATRIEGHELVEMRRIAALVYKKNKRYKQSMDLSKKDRMYRDAMETVADSDNQDLAEQLLRFFVEINDKDCFAACLYTCYDLVRPDIAMELAWRNRMLDFAMPYLIQVMREYSGRLDALDKKTQKQEEDKDKEKSAANDYVPDYMMPSMGNPLLMPQQPMLMAPTAMAPQQMQQPQMGFGGAAPGMQGMGVPGVGGIGMPQSLQPQF